MIGSALPDECTVFAAGKDGYHTYRIPAVILTASGTVLAFCEGRRNGRSDHGDIDLLLKRSSDCGATWSHQQIVYAEPGEITIGNPCPVVDQHTRTVWLLFCRNNRDVLATRSTDDGRSWSEPRDITAQIKPPEWTWYATGPVNGIQLRRGAHAGRLLVPCDHVIGERDACNTTGRSHVIYSDDHGESWQLGGSSDPSTDECTAAELSGGRLLLNMRSYRGMQRRAVAFSEDGGRSWSPPVDDSALIEPVCQGSLLALPPEQEGGTTRLLFANPASVKRENMTIRLSSDEGRGWPVSRGLYAGPSAYSCLTELPGGKIGCLYERGRTDPYEELVLVRFDLAWLTGSP